MKNLVLVLVVFCLLAQGAAAAIYSEDFQTDPFASRWTKTSSGGYPVYWTGTNPSSINAQLPAEAGNPLDALYAFSTGQKSAWTTDVTEQTTSYTVEMDFMVNGDPTVGDDSFAQWVQRQADNTAYRAGFAIGGNGQVSWHGVYGWSGYGGTPIAANNWYKLITDVTIGAANVQVKSRIEDLVGTVYAASPLYTDASAGRLTSAKGYGIWMNLPGSHYWNQALQADNFVVTPEPMTMVLLGLGGLMIRRRP